MPTRWLSGCVEPVLVLAPTGSDARVAADLLREISAQARICSSMAEVARGVEHGAAALVLASEALDFGGAELLSQVLAVQPAWSDIPVILLTLGEREGWPPAIELLMGTIGNISMLERPFRAVSFLSVLKVALRSRARQFEVRQLLESERAARSRAAAESRRADAREQELRASEERFRLIANSIPQLAWMAEPNGRLFWFNERWYEFSGADIDDPREGWRAWIAALDPEHRPAAERAWRQSIATGQPFDMEFPMRGRDRQLRWFLTRAVPAIGADGRPTIWFGTSTDITEQRATAQALRQSEERLLLAVETAQLGLWTLDPGRRRLAGSEAFRAQFGLAEPLIYDAFWRAVHPLDRAELEERLSAALRDAAPLAAEFRLVRGDGEERWVMARARPVLDAVATATELAGVSLDITERKQVEGQREAALSAERAARSEAERVARMKDEFLATLSHELRTPLNAVLGWSEVLHRTGPGSPDFERGLSAIARNARLQAQLIEDLLDTSRIVSGSLGLDLATVALPDVVEAAVESVLPTANARGVRIERVLSGATHVRGDRRRLQQIVWNLLTNAVKFSRAGGTVTVRLAATADTCVIEVEDRGQGIDAGFLPFLFERFRQQDSSRKRRSGGLGLGLSIVKHLVELHGGSVAGHSEGAGTGAVFRVTLPRLAETSEAALPPEPPLPGESHLHVLDGARILVVDDEADARELLARILCERRATVLLAGSAEEALSVVRSQRPDLIVSDIGMPGRDGLEFIRDVRALDGPARDTPAIALTAFARSEDRDLALAAGYQRHLRKPVDSLAVAATCADVLAARAARARRSPARAA
jgi:PAS domain S-box-containing protein